MKKLLILMALMLFILPFVASAQTEVFKSNTTIDLKIPCNIINCSDTITLTVVNPNTRTLLVDAKAMTILGTGYANYTLNINEIGAYNYFTIDTLDNSYYNTFDVTATGKETASAGVTIFFIGLFLILLGVLIYLFVVGLAHSLNFEYDVIDLAVNWGLYFVMFGAYTFQTIYLGDTFIASLMPTILSVTAFTHILLPIISLAISILLGSMIKQKENFGRLNRVIKNGYRI